MPAPEYVERALAIAMEAHAGQVDKLGEPYIKHPMAVAKMAGATEYDVQAAALLHDVLEDSDKFDASMLRLYGIPDRIVDAVLCLTKGRNERLSDYLNRVKYNVLARKVKLLDVAHNTDPARFDRLPEDVKERLAKKYALTKEWLS